MGKGWETPWTPALGADTCCRLPPKQFNSQEGPTFSDLLEGPSVPQVATPEHFLMQRQGCRGSWRPLRSSPPAPSPQWQERTLPPPPGEKPYLCDKCGRGFNRVDNLRSHVKTVHQGKAGIKILEPEEGGEVSVVTVDDMVTLATEALAATAVTQLTGVDITQLPGQ